MALPENVEFYTVAEVADHLRISPMSVYRYAKTGVIPSVRIGGNVRIPAGAEFIHAPARVHEVTQD